ncbi:vicilin-like seed storage protein At2g18540 [Lingula anatina]|uniref:Vicilin-like seed storage protein At2g18540 n=1 Tax=Lingula anatina TaxID=7574 RepID=A0A1S3HB95_LINAN|nr:vicilin-like seed storage protein At2g18540 [Lingula anatina]|eukprot:XP_013383278.1 vicilin-like seed storage protein At2g18540 [Lingula anatina]
MALADDKNKKIRFTPALDILLLQEVLVVNPFEESPRWAEVSTSFNAVLKERRGDEMTLTTARTVRERTAHLIQKFKKDEMESARKSGTNEEYGQREQLLTDLVALLNETQQKTKANKVDAEKAEKEEGMAVRQAALNRKEVKEGQSGVGRKRSSEREDYLAIVREREQNAKRLREEELALKREELALSKARFELEKKERERRMEAEAAREKMMLDLMKAVMEKK